MVEGTDKPDGEAGSFRAIGCHLGPHGSGDGEKLLAALNLGNLGPTRDSDGEIIGWRSVTAPAELFKTLLARNVTHFSQAKDTPFVTGPLGQKLHPFEQNQFSESILQGTVNLTGLSLNTAIHACIQEMCFPSGEDGSDPVSDLISSFSKNIFLIDEKYNTVTKLKL